MFSSQCNILIAVPMGMSHTPGAVSDKGQSETDKRFDPTAGGR